MKKLLLLLLILLSIQSLAQDKEVAIRLDSGIRADWVEPEKVFDKPESLSASDVASIEADKAFLKSLPESYENVSTSEMKNLVSKLDEQLEKLMQEKEALMKNHASQEVIDSKTGTINVV